MMRVLLACMLAAGVIGCTKEEVKSTATQAAEKTKEAATQAKELLDEGIKKAQPYVDKGIDKTREGINTAAKWVDEKTRTETAPTTKPN